MRSLGLIANHGRLMPSAPPIAFINARLVDPVHETEMRGGLIVVDGDEPAAHLGLMDWIDKARVDEGDRRR